jgi:HPt (histidine-containing phosphotransfer) domain-containing protein
MRGVLKSGKAPLDAAASLPYDGEVSTPCRLHEAIDGLREFQQQGEPDIVLKLFDLYLTHSPHRIRDLEAAQRGGDTTLLARTAHTLRSSSELLGASLLSGLCQNLETRAQQNVSISQEEVAEIRDAYSEFEKKLRALLNPEGRWKKS